MTTSSMNSLCSPIRLCYLFVWVLFTLESVTAFSPDGFIHVNSNRPGTKLQAWSLPSPSSMAASFSGVGGSTWYNEYNPTYRRTVYDDDDRFNPYGFMAVGDDWPLAFDSTTPTTAAASLSTGKQQQNRRGKLVNPFRSIVRRLRRNTKQP